MIDFGVVNPGTTLYIPFATYDSNDPAASVTLTGLATSDIEIYKDGSTTQRGSDSGYALLDTDGIDFDAITGIHGFSINLADNATAGFYAAGSQYWVVVSSVTVDAGTVNFIAATFRIGYPAAILNTTIATLASQTSFTLTSGPAEDDALNGRQVIIHDVASAVQCGAAIILDYTGSTKTVTLAAGTTFTAAATDNISIMQPAPLQPATMGRTVVVDSAGLVDANAVKVGPTGSGTAQTARDIGASVLLSSGTGTGQVKLSSGYIAPNWGDVGNPTTTVGLSGTTVGTLTTYTGNTVQTGDSYARIGATGSGLTSLAPSATALSTATWTGTRAGYLDNLSAGAVATASALTSAAADITTLLGKFTGITLLAQWLGLLAGKQTPNSTALTEINATGAGSGTYSATTDSQEALRDRGDAAWITATGFSTHSAADVVTALGTGTSLTAIPWNAAWDTEVQSECADALTAFGWSSITISAVSGAVGSVTGAVGSVTGNVGGNVTGSVGSVTGGINTSGGTITTLDALDTAQDTQHASTLSKMLKYFQLLFRKDAAIATDNATEVTAINADGGSGAGAYANTTDAVEAIRDNMGTAQTGDSYAIVSSGTHGNSALKTLIDDVPTNAELATSQAAADDATLAAIAALNNLSAAQVNTEVDTALADIHLDHLLAADYDPASKPGVATALLNEIIGSDAGVSQFTANALELAPTGGSAPTAADIRTEIDTNSTQLAAIKAKTDNLPTDPADASDVAASFTTVNNTLTAIAGYIDAEVAQILAAVDTEIAAIKAKTDNLPAAPAATGDIPTAADIRDAILNRVLGGNHTTANTPGLLLQLLDADLYVDTSTTPWAMVYMRKGTGAIGIGTELLRQSLKSTGGVNLTSTDTVVGQAIAP